MIWLLLGLFALAVGLIGTVFALLFAALWIPFMILRWVVRLVVMAVVAPLVVVVVGIAGLVGAAAVLFAILVPLLPLALVAFFVWVVVKLLSGPTVRVVQ